MDLRTRTRRSLALAACLVTAACGSTVDLATVRGADGELVFDGTGSGTGSGRDDGDGDGDGMAGPNGTDPDGDGSSAAGPGTTRTTTRGRTSTTQRGGGSDATSGFGWDDKFVNLGLAYVVDDDVSAGQFTVSTGESLDYEAAANLLVKDINDAGGILGRKVRITFGKIPATTSSMTTSFQAVCETFTADTKVFAATSLFVSETAPLLATCMAQKKAVFFTEVGHLWDQTDAATWVPSLLSPAVLGYDRFGAVVDRAQGAGFFGAQAKVGVLYNDSASGRRTLDRVVKPALRRYGHAVVEYAISPPGGGSAADTLKTNSTQSTAAVTYFKDEDVTHVMFLGTNGRGPLTFHPQAAKEVFTPKYLYSTSEKPEFARQQLARGGATAAADLQLAGAIGVGWSPAADTGEADGKSTPAGERCLKRLTDGGIHVRDEPQTALHMCSFFWSIDALIEKAGAFDRARIAAVYPTLGSLFATPSTFAIAPKPGRPDGVAAAALFAYNTQCHCWRYTGEAQPLP